MKLNHIKIDFFCPRWGSEDINMKQFCEKVRDAGYDGVEMSLPLEEDAKGEILSCLKEFDLKLIAQHWETSTIDFETHKIEYSQRLNNLASSNAIFINSQTGKDFFNFEQNTELIEIAGSISNKSGVKIIHETHRGKFSFAAHVAANYLKKIPNLRITLDISHWINVAESWLDDQSEAVNLALTRTDHIHARVGFPEGPQIPDPRVAEWAVALEKHLIWWQNIIDQRKKEAWNEFTITSEFGPYPYMTILPSTKQPISNQWEVNRFMMEYLRSNIKTEL